MQSVCHYPSARQKQGFKVVMDNDQSKIYVNVKLPVRKKSRGIKLNKCNQCNYSSTRTDHLRAHVQNRHDEKVHKCNQCNYSSSRADYLRGHEQKHTGKKSYRCSQCKFAIFHAWSLRTHLKMKSQTYAVSATLHPLK